MRKFICILLLTLVLIPHTAGLAAQKQTGLTITPLRSKPVQKPGDTTTGELTVTNNTESSMTVVLSVERFKVIDEAYHYDFSPGEYTDWVRLTDQKVQLEKNTNKKIAYSLAVPANAPPGGYYFALFVSTEKSQNSATFTEVERVASLIYLEVSGLIERKTNLLGVDTSWFQTSKDISITSRVTNEGNSHQQVRLKHTLRPLLGRTPESQQSEALVLPGTIRAINKTLRMPRWPGIYRLVTEFSPPQGGIQKSVQTIIFVPVLFSLGLLGLFVVILVIFWRRRRTQRNQSVCGAAV